MEEKDDLIKGYILSFSQEKRMRNNIKENTFLNHYKTNQKNNYPIKFNKSNKNNRLQNLNINVKIDFNERLNLKESIKHNKFLLKRQKMEDPIKIKKEKNQINKFLPILNDEKQIFVNNSLSKKKKFLIRTQQNFGDSKKMKNMKKLANKSYFSVDKIRLKKKNLKRNIKQDMDTIKQKGKQYIRTVNTNVNMKTYINKENKNERYSPCRIPKKRGFSSRSVNSNFPKKKITLKNKTKIHSNKSSSDLIDSYGVLKSDLMNMNKNDNNINNINNNDIDNIIIPIGNKICDYLITKYDCNEQSIVNNATSIKNNENDDNIIQSPQKSQIQTNFYVYHFFKSNSLYFFVPNSKYDQLKDKLNNNFFRKDNNDKNIVNQINNNNNSQNEIKNYEIIENFYLPQAFRPRMNKWTNMPECILDTCKNGGFSLIKNFDNCNLIWKLVHPNKMKIMIRNLHQNQKYNHYISTFHLGRKDNLYKHFKYYKRLFPDMYNYAPATYILPMDGPDFENEFRKNKKALWIVKPVNLSRGRGIHLLKGENEYKTLYKKSTQLSMPQYLISKYIDKPHLLNNKKYDLRIYVLVASFTPLRIYLYNNGLVRFATEDYTKEDLDNVFIHLTNYSINKNNVKYKSNNNIKEQQCEIYPREETEGTEAEAGIEGDIDNLEEGEGNVDDNTPDDDSNKWSLIEYRNYFKKLGKGNIMEMIWSQIEAIVIKTVISVSKEFYKNIFQSKINNTFELYGFDILIDHNFRAWLMEVNVNPSLHCTSPLDLSIKTDLISDIFNVVGILPYNHNDNKSIFNYSMINKKKEEINTIRNKSFEKKNVNKLNKTTEREEFMNKMTIKSNILKNFDSEKMEKKLPEYDDEYYKKIIEIFNEEKSRSHSTDFSLLFPLKNNIKLYGNILIKDNAVNDYNIVLWQHILTHN